MKKNNEKVMTLREEDLHFLVSESVKTILRENGEDEGVLGGIGALGSRLGNRVKTQTQKLGDALGGGL